MPIACGVTQNRGFPRGVDTSPLEEDGDSRNTQEVRSTSRRARCGWSGRPAGRAGRQGARDQRGTLGNSVNADRRRRGAADGRCRSSAERAELARLRRGERRTGHGARCAQARCRPLSSVKDAIGAPQPCREVLRWMYHARVGADLIDVVASRQRAAESRLRNDETQDGARD